MNPKVAHVRLQDYESGRGFRVVQFKKCFVKSSGALISLMDVIFSEFRMGMEGPINVGDDEVYEVWISQWFLATRGYEGKMLDILGTHIYYRDRIPAEVTYI